MTSSTSQSPLEEDIGLKLEAWTAAKVAGRKALAAAEGVCVSFGGEQPPTPGDHKISYILIGQLIYVSKVVNKFVKKRESIYIMILLEVKVQTCFHEDYNLYNILIVPT